MNKEFIEWVGVACALIGSFMLSNAMFEGYFYFTVSSLCLIYTAIRQSNKALIAMQFAFLMFNLNGIYTFFIKG